MVCGSQLGDNFAFRPSLVSAAPRDHSGLAHFARKSHSLCRANYATCSCVTGEHFRPRAAQDSRSNMPPTDASNSSHERLRTEAARPGAAPLAQCVPPTLGAPRQASVRRKVTDTVIYSKIITPHKNTTGRCQHGHEAPPPQHQAAAAASTRLYHLLAFHCWGGGTDLLAYP
ncbi:hypothetical protein O3P69_001517 [Scylla paramamosain]|uniref:Uncharacterized protein n=1 Tax=Scylla paramamosain TaxID=85552 RepID=A0AAW0V114_SCYPA